MIGTLILALGVTALSVVGLALGVIFGRPPLKGSCGGLSCETCKLRQHAEAGRCQP